MLTRKRLADLEIKIGKLKDTGGVAVPAGSISLAEIEDDILEGSKVATVANANVVGGLLVVHRVLLASGADADVDVQLTHKTRFVDAVIVLKGAGTTGSIVTIKNVTSAITEAVDVASGSDKDIFRPATADDANQEIAAAANLRVSYASTSADFPGAEVYVTGMRV